MTSAEIRLLFPVWSRGVFYDVTYALPTTRWLFDEFVPWFRTQRFKANRHKWERKNDCDNFARAFAVFAADAHNEGRSDLEGIAVGVFCYIGSSHVRGPHAITCAITEEGLIFIEPQTGQRLALTPAEIQTCFHYEF